MKKKDLFEKYSPSAYYDAIISRIENNSELAYYLLKRRLSRALKAVYEAHGFGLSDDYEDTIDDYFLYLYEGDQEGGSLPFAMLERIHDRQAFFSWVLSTYRHFLLNKAREETKRKALMAKAFVHQKEEGGPLYDEAMIMYLSTAIAYADQQFSPRNRFVFYRMLMTFLDREKAVPQELMAQTLEMHPVTYRVCNKRQKERFLKVIAMLERGETVVLDAKHRLIRDQLEKRFDNLYEALAELYDEAIDCLPMAADIQALRVRYGGDSMVHESLSPYGFGIAWLYPKLKDFLSKS